MTITFWDETTGECLFGCGRDAAISTHAKDCPAIEFEKKITRLENIKKAARAVIAAFTKRGDWGEAGMFLPTLWYDDNYLSDKAVSDLEKLLKGEG